MKIAISGSSGRIGVELLKLIAEESNYILSGVLTREDYKKNNDIFNDSDVIIDFTSPKRLVEIAQIAEKYNKPLVSGTTGLTEEDFKILKKIAKKIPIYYSSNMSVGINICKQILKDVSKKLDKNFDIEIIEYHHRYKKDAPSGTSLMLGKAIAEAKNIDFNKYAVFDRQTVSQVRKENQIGFSSVRAGNIFGEHSVIFASDGEIIEIKHTSMNRKIYAQGALLAASWVLTQKPGFYTNF